MKIWNRLSLFIGDKTEYWNPLLTSVIKGFLNNNVFFYPSKIIYEVNRVFNVLFNILVKKNTVIWIVDSKSIYKEAINSHHKELDELNIFYITESLPYGFIDNKQCLNFHKMPDPNIVFFTNIAPGDFLLKGLKKRGILSIGLSAGYVEGLDYPIYGNNNNGGICTPYTFIISYYTRKC